MKGIHTIKEAINRIHTDNKRPKITIKEATNQIHINNNRPKIIIIPIKILMFR